MRLQTGYSGKTQTNEDNPIEGVFLDGMPRKPLY